MNENRHNAGKKDPRELLRRAKEGDEGAFGALYEIYYTPVYRYLFLRSRSKADAEDIAQTVFVKVYASLERFEIHEEPLCYFFSVARNALIDFHRKKRESVFSEMEVPDGAAFDAADEHESHTEKADRNMMTDVVREAMHVLSNDQQEAISLRFFGELSTKEISAVMGKSEEAVRQLQSRGLRMLQKKLKHHA